MNYEELLELLGGYHFQKFLSSEYSKEISGITVDGAFIYLLSDIFSFADENISDKDHKEFILKVLAEWRSE
jgi:hypothetical protein